MNEPLGIWKKYTVTHSNGQPVENDADYFVLKFTDQHAREALRRYAESVRRFNPILARELTERCNEYDYQKHLDRRNGNGAR